LTLRNPAVAGSFYPGDREDLSGLIRNCYSHPIGPERFPPEKEREAKYLACVSPHAGFEYSGPVAAHTYLHVSSFGRPDLIVIVGPNHHGVGGGVSTFKEGAWETPLGKMNIDSTAASELVKVSGIVDFNEESHRREHSIEVQLPFLQSLYGDSVPFLPISLLFQDMETATTLGRSIAQIASGRRAILVASSDLTHYEPYDAARKKDAALLEQVAKMDVPGFYRTLEGDNVTACGYGAIATVITAAGLLGLGKGELLKYASSGDTGGDKTQVVGYGSLRFV